MDEHANKNEKYYLLQNKIIIIGILEIIKKIHAINNADPAQIALLGLNQIYAMNKRIDYDWPSYTFYVRNFEEIKLVK